MPDLLHALVGIVGLVALAWLLSENRRAVPWRAIAPRGWDYRFCWELSFSDFPW